MTQSDFIAKLVNMFRYWILTTACRSINFYETFIEKTRNLYTLNDICDIINITAHWSDTNVGYDVCSETQLEWSVISLITFFRLDEAGEFEGLSSQERADMEECLTDVLLSSLNKFKKNTNLWDKRKEQKSGHLIMLMNEKYIASDGNDTSLSAKISVVLAGYNYL